MPLKKVSEHAYAILKFFEGNIGIIDTGNFSLIIDVGMGKSTAKKILSLVKRNQISKIKYIIYTHYHPDHITGPLPYLVDAKIIAHQETQKIISKQLNTKKKKPKIKLADIVISNDYSIKDNINIKILINEAHCPGSIMVYVEQDNVLFCGDNILKDWCQNFSEANYNQIRECFKKIRELSPTIIIPGHGNLADLKHVDIVEQYLNDLKKYKDGEYSKIKQIPKTWKFDFLRFHPKNCEWIKETNI